MKGVKYKPMSAQKMLAKNLGIYGIGGVIVPFVGIKIIDILISPLLAMLVCKEDTEMKTFFRYLRSGLVLTVLMLAICGVIYPSAMTG